ncbi:MAG: hypothetical protein LBF83_06920 [Spirochaetaceae bacterium]|jgi:hypothetical protein|nr:hypothetical protein [Spirochaetaceae bacterium]
MKYGSKKLFTALGCLAALAAAKVEAQTGTLAQAEAQAQTVEESIGNEQLETGSEVTVAVGAVEAGGEATADKSGQETAPEPGTPPEVSGNAGMVTPDKAEPASGNGAIGRAAPAGKLFTVGAGVEANNNNPNGAAFGGVIGADFRPFRFFTVGLKGGFSSNFGKSNTVEAAATAAFVLRAWRLDFIVRGAAGVGYVITYENSEAAFLYEGGLGVRIRMKGFYTEPYVRLGSPFLWGAGVMFGKSFRLVSE